MSDLVGTLNGWFTHAKAEIGGLCSDGEVQNVKPEYDVVP